MGTKKKKGSTIVLPTKYKSLKQLRSDKKMLKGDISESAKSIREDVRDCFLADRSYLESSSSYMRYIGYGLSALKTINTISGIFGYISRKFK